jgi:hypothetical protein
MQLRANRAALVPPGDPWLGIGTRMGSPPALLGVAAVAVVPVPVPVPVPTSRDVHAAVAAGLRAAWPRVVAIWRSVQRALVAAEEVKRVLWWVRWLATFIIAAWYYFKAN